MWKALILLSVVVCVVGDEHGYAKSEQKVIIHHSPAHHGHYGKLGHIGEKKPEHHEVYAWSYPSYEFHYKVEDPHTKDFKGHHEWRDGDVVKGEYWLIEPDGSKRTVKYHADDKSGFNAIVHHTMPEHKNSDTKSDVHFSLTKSVLEEKEHQKPMAIVYEIKQKHPVHKVHHEEPKHQQHVEIKNNIKKEELSPKHKNWPSHHEIGHIHQHKHQYEEHKHGINVPVIYQNKPLIEHLGSSGNYHYEESQQHNVHEYPRVYRKYEVQEKSDN